MTERNTFQNLWELLCMSRRRAQLLLALTMVLAMLAGPVAFATSTPDITATPAIDTPTKTYTISGTEYTVSSLGHTGLGTDLSYTVDVSDDIPLFTVHLYNSEKQIVESTRHEEPGTYSFTTTGLEPGTYVLALSIDGSIEAIHPVVVSGYEYTMDAPSEQSAEDPVSINIELTETSGTPNRVEIAVMNDTVQRNYVATKIDDGTYNVVISDLAPGEYRLYAGTRGTDEIDGRDELTGLSSAHRLTLTAEQTTTTTTTTTTSSDSGGSSGTQSTTTTTTTTVSTTTTTTDSGESTSDSATNSTKSGPASTTNTTTSKTTSSTTVTTATTSTSTAIQPASTTPPPTATAAPGFTIWSSLVGLFVLLLLRRR